MTRHTFARRLGMLLPVFGAGAFVGAILGAASACATLYYLGL